jgi:hypothetical protein
MPSLVQPGQFITVSISISRPPNERGTRAAFIGRLYSRLLGEEMRESMGSVRVFGLDSHDTLVCVDRAVHVVLGPKEAPEAS